MVDDSYAVKASSINTMIEIDIFTSWLPGLHYHASLRMKLHSHIMVARFTQSCFIAEENYFLASWLLGLRYRASLRKKITFSLHGC